MESGNMWKMGFREIREGRGERSYCYNCILLLVIVDLLLYLIYKFNFIISMCIYKKKHSIVFKYSIILAAVSGICWGPWTIFPTDKKEPLYVCAYICVYSKCLTHIQLSIIVSNYFFLSFCYFETASLNIINISYNSLM